jgi:hypothetical protein
MLSETAARCSKHLPSAETGFDTAFWGIFCLWLLNSPLRRMLSKNFGCFRQE